ncbi:MAG: hypothetical protein SOZ58_04975 [Prevotella sp.]|nr:hypothetical protein [Prevotella sp.]
MGRTAANAVVPISKLNTEAQRYNANVNDILRNRYERKNKMDRRNPVDMNYVGPEPTN